MRRAARVTRGGPTHSSPPSRPPEDLRSGSELHFAILVSARFNCINRLVQGHGIEHTTAIGDSWKTEQGLEYSILELDDT